jgi:hypothetical protein
VHQDRRDAGELGWCQVAERAAGEALGHDEIEFGVKLRKQQPGLRHAHLREFAFEIAEFGEHGHHTVICACDGMCSMFDPVLQLLAFRALTEVALAPARMVLAIGATVTGMCAHAFAQLIDVDHIVGSDAAWLGCTHGLRRVPEQVGEGSTGLRLT